MKTKSIRKALSNEANKLSDLAIASKSYWGYDHSYLEVAQKHIKVTAKDIQEDLVCVIENNDNILGFYHFRYIEPELVWLFVDPKYIGQGIGRLLWDHLLQSNIKNKINEFFIKSDPNAEAFYLKQGALRIGTKPSTVDKAMKLPVLKYILKETLNESREGKGII
jgi:GNAT superfamily N-acetyltransferase